MKPHDFDLTWILRTRLWLIGLLAKDLVFTFNVNEGGDIDPSAGFSNFGVIESEGKQ